MNIAMNNRIYSAFAAVILWFPGASVALDYAEFIFNVNVPKNTCNISVNGDGPNSIDFGTLPLNKLKNEAGQGKIKKSFTVTLSNCKNNFFSGNVVKISGNYVNDGYLDIPENREFAVRISDKNNAVQSDNVFYSPMNDVIWSGIDGSVMSKDFTAYIMCKNGIADCSASDGNLGEFKSSITLMYLAD